MYRSPVDLYVDEWVYQLLEPSSGSTRAGYSSTASPTCSWRPDTMRFREYMYSLAQRLSRKGVGVIMTSELPDLFAVTRLSEHGISHLADNVILLQYLRPGHASCAP